MPEVDRKTFAALCGIKVNSLNTYIVRKKVYVQKNKKINTDDPLNVKFKADRENARRIKKKIEAFKKQVVSIDDSVTRVVKKTTRTTKAEKEAKEKQAQSSAEYAEWARRKEKALSVKAEREAELKTLQVEKMMGKLMPVELVHQILKINVQSVFINFENELINIASIYCDILAGGDRKKLAEIIKKMRQSLKRIIKDTETNAAKEIEGVVDEYSETRSRGERG